MAVSSTSTLAELRAQYDDNADYDLAGSVAKAKLFIHAARILLGRVPKRVQHGGMGADGYELDQETLQRELNKAEAWWRANDSAAAGDNGNPGVGFYDFSDFRR